MEILRKSLPSGPGPSRTSRPGFEIARGQIILSLMAGKFAALWSLDPKFSALKDLNPFKTMYKIQEASSILKVGFARFKWPYLHRAYLATVPFILILAVYTFSKIPF